MIIEFFILVAGIVYVLYRVIKEEGWFRTRITLKQQDHPAAPSCNRQEELLNLSHAWNCDRTDSLTLCDMVGWPIGNANDKIIALRIVSRNEGWEYVEIPGPSGFRYEANDMPERVINEYSELWRGWVQRYPSSDKKKIIRSCVSPSEVTLNNKKALDVAERLWFRKVTSKLYPWRQKCYPNSVGVKPEDFETEAEYETEIALRQSQKTKS